MSRLTTEFIDSCAKELGSKRHRVELPWERSGLKEILNPSSFPELKIPAPTWVDVPALSSEAVIPVGPQSLISPVPFKHARAKLSEITWAGAEDKKLHLLYSVGRSLFLIVLSILNLERSYLQQLIRVRAKMTSLTSLRIHLQTRLLQHCVQGLLRC